MSIFIAFRQRFSERKKVDPPFYSVCPPMLKAPIGFAFVNPLLHICDLYDTALCLRVLWILYHSHVQVLLAFAECDVCCAITRGDLKYVQKLAVARYLQNLTAEPLGDINVTLAVDLHAIRSKPPGFDLVFCEKVQQSKIRSVAQRAVVIDLEFQHAVSDGFADVEGLLIWRDRYP